MESTAKRLTAEKAKRLAAEKAKDKTQQRRKTNQSKTRLRNTRGKQMNLIYYHGKAKDPNNGNR